MLISPTMGDATAVDSESVELATLELPTDVVIGPAKQAEKDFFANLYSGDVPTSGPLETAGTSPEDYYKYLETWFRAQKGLHSQSAALESPTGAAPTAPGGPYHHGQQLPPGGGHLQGGHPGFPGSAVGHHGLHPVLAGAVGTVRSAFSPRGHGGNLRA